MLLARWLRVALYIYPFFRKRGIMLILVTYDVSLDDSRGQKRLRHVAKIVSNTGYAYRTRFLNA